MRPQEVGTTVFGSCLKETNLPLSDGYRNPCGARDPAKAVRQGSAGGRGRGRAERFEPIDDDTNIRRRRFVAKVFHCQHAVAFATDHPVRQPGIPRHRGKAGTPQTGGQSPVPDPCVRLRPRSGLSSDSRSSSHRPKRPRIAHQPSTPACEVRDPETRQSLSPGGTPAGKISIPAASWANCSQRWASSAFIGR